MNVYAIANQKGGVGKTATTVNLWGALAGFGRRVLLLDLDPQGHLTSAAGVERADSGPADANLPKALLGKWRGNLGDLIRPADENLYVIPTCDEMFLLEAEMYGRPGRERLLTRFLDGVAAAGVVEDVLIDCPPSLGPLNDAALVAARDRGAERAERGRVVVPVEAEDSSLGALRLLLRQLATLEEVLGIRLLIAGLLVNMYDARRGRIATSTLAAYQSHPLGVLGVLGQRKEVTEAWRARKTVERYAPDSEIAAGYRGVALTLAEDDPAAVSA